MEPPRAKFLPLTEPLDLSPSSYMEISDWPNHKTLQILINLISNAKRACLDSAKHEKVVSLRVRQNGERIADISASRAVEYAA